MLIRTVLGDIDATQLGVCYAHEHLIIERSYTTQLVPDLLLNSVELACQELSELYALGGRALIDTMPCDSGRNVLKLAEISRRTGLHIVCPTGLHLEKYYPAGHWRERLSAEELAELFIADIQEGIDANDYGGPVLQRTPHRAGLIKVASGGDQLSPHEQKIFTAAALTHRATGAPILTHTQEGRAAVEQVQFLARLGVPPDKITLSHTDRHPDVAYHRAILQTGARVEYDGAFRWKAEQEPGKRNPTLDLLVALFAAGLGEQIMLGMDAARYTYWESYGGQPGMTYLLKTFVPQLRAAGFTEADIEMLFVQNPQRAFSFSDTLA